MTDTTTDLTAAPLRDLSALPKGHLHIHHEAAIRPTTLMDMAEAEGITITIPTEFDDFSDFSATYRGMLRVLSKKENFFRLVDESIEDCAIEGVVYAEFGASPQFYVDTFGSLEESLEAMLEACAASGEKWGVEIGLMITVDRTESVEAANQLAHLAAAYAGRGVVSLGLANDERGYPAAKFAEAFAIAKEAGLLSTPHAGELEGPDYVLEALDVLHADRILHGVRSATDAALVARLAEDGVCLDICPTSNVLLSAVDGFGTHPLVTLLEAGVRCSINADDPVLFGPSILDEYEVSRTTLGLTDEQLADCAWSSIDCSGASDSLKESARAGIAAWLAS